MIISASRRTDIPAFYGRWFMNRIKLGFCLVRNPFNPNHIQRVLLRPEDVSCFVFWTRNAKSFIPILADLETKSYPFYFLYTVTGYGKELETHLPNISTRIMNFMELSDLIGSNRIIWRYDPIIISEKYSFDEHLKMFENLCSELGGYTNRVIVSFVDYYRKTLKNLSRVSDHFDQEPEQNSQLNSFIKNLVEISKSQNLQITSCSEEINLTPFQLKPGKCIDDELISSLFDIDVSHKKDSHQRKHCQCVESKDIGAYNTCPFGCLYCYATNNRLQALKYLKKHDSECEWL